MIAIRLGDGKDYTAPVEKVYATLQRWHARENPSGKKRRRLFTSSEEYRKYKGNIQKNFNPDDQLRT